MGMPSIDHERAAELFIQAGYSSEAAIEIQRSRDEAAIEILREALLAAADLTDGEDATDLRYMASLLAWPL